MTLMEHFIGKFRHILKRIFRRKTGRTKNTEFGNVNRVEPRLHFTIAYSQTIDSVCFF